MKVRLMQIIDFWVGVPICILLSFFNHLSKLFSNPTSSKKPKKILFIELSEMGSAIIAYSSLVKAGQLFPDSEIYFLIFNRNRESCELLGIIPKNNILVIDDSSFLKFTLSSLKILFKIRKIAFDVVIDLEIFSRFTTIISFLSGARIRIGFHNLTSEGLYRGNLLTHQVFYNPHQHMSLNFLALVNSLEDDPKNLPLVKKNLNSQLVELPSFSASTQEKEKIWNLLKQENPKITEDSKLIIFNPDPGQALPLRGWPLNNYLSLAQKIISEIPDSFITIVGVKESFFYANTLIKALGQERMVDLTGKTSNLRELLTVFKFADLLITNDSGPAHFASLTTIPTLVLFGPETPTLYAPLGKNAVNLFAALACSPCLSAANHRYSLCQDNKCLQAISVETVWQNTKKII